MPGRTESRAASARPYPPQVMRDEARNFRAGSDERHLTADQVYQLWELIHTSRAPQPTHVTRGSRRPLTIGPRRSASTTVVRNFHILNRVPQLPTHPCRENAGPGLESCIASAR